jgi:N-hydroxyarylamine O-acetyltransferase
MNTFDFPLSQYLARIGLTAPPNLDENGLKQVHAAQAFSIPFEDLDIHLGKTISLKPEDLVAKLINSQRGGYCFELNGILCMALKALGFAVRPLLARVLYGAPVPTSRTHEVLIVTIAGQKWLADVGFGGPGLRSPMLIAAGEDEEQYGEHYRLRQDPEYGLVLQKETKGSLLDLYVFDDKEITLDADIEMANHFTSTWPDSLFRLRRMCVLPHPWGRVTLDDMELSIYRNGEVIHQALQPGLAYMNAIVQHFGIHTNTPYESFAPLKQI